MTSLPEFFAQIEPLLSGKIDAAEFEARLGASPCGPGRLFEYRERARAALHGILEPLFPATRRAASATRHGLWVTLLHRFESASPATHFAPSRFGRPFPKFLCALAAAGALPDYLAEVADFEWLSFSLANGARDGGSYFVRDYCCDVLEYVSKEPPGLPKRRALALVVYRSPRDGRVSVLQPNAAERFALEACGAKPPADMTERSIAAAERRLVRLGVLPAA